MDLENVFAFLRTIGGEAPPITLIGCEPADVGEAMELSPLVSDMVAPAADLVRRLLTKTLAETESGQKGSYECSEV